jgi:hypothetical protein
MLTEQDQWMIGGQLVGMQFSMGQIWPPGMLGSNPQFQDQSQK